MVELDDEEFTENREDESVGEMSVERQLDEITA